MTVDIRAVSGRRAWESIKGTYRRIYLSSLQKGNVFLSYEYLDVWLERYEKADSEQPYLLLGCNGADLIGIAPFVTSDASLLLRYKLTSMGCTLSDSLDWLVLPGFEKDFFSAVLEYLSHETAFRTVELGALTDRSCLWDFLHEKAPTGWDRMAIYKTSEKYISFDFSKSFEENIPAAARKYVHKKIRQLGREGKLCFTSCVDDKGLEQLLDVLFSLHIQRWSHTSTPSKFRSEKVRKYYRALGKAMLDAGRLELNGLYLDNEPLAIHFGFLDGERFYQYTTAYNTEYLKYSPGHVLIYHTLQKAYNEAIPVFDMLRGNEGYKNFWTDKSVKAEGINLYKRDLLSRFIRLGDAFVIRLLRPVRKYLSGFVKWLGI